MLLSVGLAPRLQIKDDTVAFSLNRSHSFAAVSDLKHLFGPEPGKDLDPIQLLAN